jgi:hypothetical protein
VAKFITGAGLTYGDRLSKVAAVIVCVNGLELANGVVPTLVTVNALALKSVNGNALNGNNNITVPDPGEVVSGVVLGVKPVVYNAAPLVTRILLRNPDMYSREPV